MPVDASGEWFVLLTESFAVRAMLGSLAAAALSGLAVRLGLVQSSRARRLLVLAPILTAAVAAVASVGETYLPQVWVSTPAAGSPGQLLDLLGELRVMSPDHQLDLLLVGYAAVAGLLLARRFGGVVSAYRLVGRASLREGYGALVPVVHRLAARMQVPTPRLVVVDDCPGGAFTFGMTRPVVAVDPWLIEELDDRELEGLLAHELAHISRRDTLLSLLIGVFRDVTFFLVPMHIAARWLRKEQEESADELASGHTKRPVALASSILKVWERSGGRGYLQAACAAVPRVRPAVAGGPPLTGPAKTVAERVQRLIDLPPTLPLWRRCAEVGLAGAVTATAATMALGIPSWVATEYDATALALGYLSNPSASKVESPAFSTFRELSPARSVGQSHDAARSPDVTRRQRMSALSRAACPCVESRAQIARRERATVDAGRLGMVWGSADHSPWRVTAPDERVPVRPARPLLTLHDADQQVGFFLVGPTIAR